MNGYNEGNLLSKEYRFLSWLQERSDLADENGIIKSTQVDLARAYGCSPATVNNWIKSLKENKCIKPYKSRSGYIITNRGEEIVSRCKELEGLLRGDAPSAERVEGSTSANQPLNYIDVFSGCGGLSLGLGEAGWKGLFAIEKDPMAFSTFYHNLVAPQASYRHFDSWPSWLSKEAHSIEDVLNDARANVEIKKLRGKVSLVAGGPPCQGFSVAGARNGKDPRNLLVFKQLKLVNEIKPLFVIIENVGGFEKKFVLKPSSNSKQSVATAAMLELETLGYNVGKVVINAADYGVPQVRRRVIIFGISKDKAGVLNAEKLLEDMLADAALSQKKQLKLPTNRPVNVEEAIGDLAGDIQIPDAEFPAFNTSDYLPASSSYQKLMRRKVTAKEKPNCHRFNRHSEKLIALYNKAHDTQPAGRLSKEFLYENGCHSNKRYVLDTTKPCSTLTTAPEELIHFKHPRVVTLREMARLQSFPDAFHFYGRYTLNGPARGVDVPRNAQIGNAIPPLAGRALGAALEHIGKMINTNSSKLEKYRQ